MEEKQNERGDEKLKCRKMEIEKGAAWRSITRKHVVCVSVTGNRGLVLYQEGQTVGK